MKIYELYNEILSPKKKKKSQIKQTTKMFSVEEAKKKIFFSCKPL